MNLLNTTRILIGALIVASALLPAGANAASSATANMSVSASVAQKCIISNSPAVAFGAYDPVVTNKSANLDQTGTIQLTCTKGATGITLRLGSSANAPAGCTAPQRCLVSSAHYLNYQLYSNSTRSLVWTTAIAETVSGGITAPTNVTVYGRIPGGQNANVGASYADTLVATVNY